MSGLYCTRCASDDVTFVRHSLDARFPIVACGSCGAQAPATGNEALARSIVRDRAGQADVDRHNRHLLEGREVASCGRCMSAKLKRRYDQALSS